MRRKDREIADTAEILQLLERCDTLRLGLICGGRPYIVPVSFGLDTTAERPAIYFHSAKAGLKTDLMRQNDHVCVEADIFYRTERTEQGITARYESVIGFGTVSVAEGEEAAYGLNKILQHYRYTGDRAEQCAALSHTAVYKITLCQLTGKRNLPDDAK